MKRRASDSPLQKKPRVKASKKDDITVPSFTIKDLASSASPIPVDAVLVDSDGKTNVSIRTILSRAKASPVPLPPPLVRVGGQSHVYNTYPASFQRSPDHSKPSKRTAALQSIKERRVSERRGVQEQLQKALDSDEPAPSNEVKAEALAKAVVPLPIDNAQALPKYTRWTKTEDELLKIAVANIGGPPYNWKRISADYFPNSRNSNQCRSRWVKLQPSNQAPFTREEDSLIISKRHAGSEWNDIALLLPSRTREQIRYRFLNVIDPELKKKVPWTHEEDTILHQSRAVLGNSWKKIAERLPGRSENDVKNRFHNAKDRQRRKLKAIVKQHQRQEAVEAVREPAQNCLDNNTPSIKQEDENLYKSAPQKE